MIAVTGAAGLVGGNLIRALIAEGRDVRALVHADRRALAGLPVEQVTGDVTDLASLERAFAGVEVVYHLAGSISLEMNSWPEMEAINVQGTRNVIAACRKCGVRRLIFFSSVHALEQAPYDQPVDETRPLADTLGQTPYDRSKAAGERAVREAAAEGLDAVILNPTAMLGPYDFKPSYLGRAVLALAKGRIPGLVRGGFDWVDVRDVVAGALQAERQAPRGSVYLLSGSWHSVRELAQIIAAQTGQAAPILTISYGLAWLAAPLAVRLMRINGGKPIFTRVTLRALRSNHQISHAKAERELCYSPRPLAETVRDTLAWFQANGYMEKK